MAGGLGVNWFADHKDGWGGATFGYVIGFVAAATLVGWLAQRGGDRTVVRTAVTMVLGNLVIYAVGVPWLMGSTGMDLADRRSQGRRAVPVRRRLKVPPRPASSPPSGRSSSASRSADRPASARPERTPMGHADERAP